jgi:hypothetical protein
LDFDILVSSLREDQRRKSGGRRDSSVTNEMMDINTQQRARSIGHGNLCVPDRERVASAQIACGRQRSAIEPNRLSVGLDDPDAFTPLYCEGDSGFYAGDDDVSVRAAD